MAAGSDDPTDLPRPRIVLATMARDTIGLHTHVSIVQAMQTGRCVHHLVVASGPYLDAGRNKAIHGAMQLLTSDSGAPAWDWFLFVDSDIEFDLATYDALFHVVAHPAYSPVDYPVIGGVYVNPFDDAGVEGDTPDPTYPGHIGPVVYEWRERDDLPGQLNGTPTPTFVRLSRNALATLPPVDEPWNPPGTDTSPSPVTSVAAIGTGFLAIHHSILTTLGQHHGEPLPWFDEPVVNGVHYGEDFGFCHRVRELGYPVLAHRGCTPMHHKTIKLI